MCKGKKLKVTTVEDYKNYKLVVNRKRGFRIEFTGKD
jgi:hypothetical protein